jgi:hypothetical protein
MQQDKTLLLVRLQAVTGWIFALVGYFGVVNIL